MSTYNEAEHRKNDAKDRARTEMNLALRKYARRIADEMRDKIDLAFKEDEGANPDVVAKDIFMSVALSYGLIESPREVIEVGASRS